MTADPASAPTARRRRALAIVAIALGGIGLVWAAAAAYGITQMATLTYYLPPPPGEIAPMKHEDLLEEVLLLLALPLLGGTLSLAGVVIGAAGPIRARGPSWWVLYR